MIISDVFVSEIHHLSLLGTFEPSQLGVSLRITDRLSLAVQL